MLSAPPVYAGARLHIVTTVFPPYDFARNIVGASEDVCVQQLLRPGMESHTFDPTPADILAVQNCDLFIYTGGESDEWVETLLAGVDNDGMRVLRMIDCVDAVGEETVEGMTHRHEHEEIPDSGEEHAAHGDGDHVEYDEHVWSAPQNAARITDAITEVLCAIDAQKESFYRQNAASYKEQLSALDAYFHTVIDQAVRRSVIFGDRFPFRYLCDAYGISYRAAFPGCAAESEASAATMIYLIEKIKNENIPVIFTIEMGNGKIARAIAEETGCAIRMMHSCHNRTADEMAADVTYLDLMYRNADVLSEALQ